jgi:3-oxoadipate enol-lactonase
MPRLQVADILCNVVDQGDGPTLLLVHGFPLDHTMWAGQIGALSDICRVIAPDLRGFGASGVTSGTVTMAQLADDLAHLLDVLEIREPVTFCGLSMGGYVAWQFYRQYRPRLARLILCDTRAAADTAEAARLRRESADRVLVEGPGFLADAMIDKLFAPATHTEQPGCIETTRQTILSTSPVAIAATLRGMAERPDVTDTLPEIDVDTLVVCGQQDAISTVQEMRQIATCIPAARFVEIPDAGHMAPLENPRQVNQAIRAFLTGAPAVGVQSP